VGAGFEPAYSERADLQSAAFNHSATPPRRTAEYEASSTCCQLFVPYTYMAQIAALLRGVIVTVGGANLQGSFFTSGALRERWCCTVCVRHVKTRPHGQQGALLPPLELAADPRGEPVDHRRLPCHAACEQLAGTAGRVCAAAVPSGRRRPGDGHRGRHARAAGGGHRRRARRPSPAFQQSRAVAVGGPAGDAGRRARCRPPGLAGRAPVPPPHAPGHRFRPRRDGLPPAHPTRSA
jgi:hypothetical protein